MMKDGFDAILPEKIKRLTAGKAYAMDTVGMSGSQVRVFDDRVLKIEKCRKENDETVRMMRWLCGRIPVPEVLCYETDGISQYLLMSRVGGKMSCDTYYLERPEELLKLLSDAVKILWSVDITDCPRNTGLEADLAEAGRRVRQGLVDMEHVEPETFGRDGFESPQALLRWLEDNKPEEELVLSHGDFCLPNIFLENGRVSGFIDLGNTGAADRWKDIALCYRSLKHNYDGSYGGRVYQNFDPDRFFEKLGIKPDWAKIRYYTLLDELF